MLSACWNPTLSCLKTCPVVSRHWLSFRPLTWSLLLTLHYYYCLRHLKHLSRTLAIPCFPKEAEKCFQQMQRKSSLSLFLKYLVAFVNSSVNKLKHGISLLFKNYKRLWEATQEKQDRVIGNLTLLYSVFIQDSINHSPIVGVLLWSPFQIWDNPITVEITSKAQHVFRYWYRG